MSSSAKVLDIFTLENLKGALTRFEGEAKEALQAADQEIHRTLDWLQERLNHWQNQVRRWQAEVDRAKSVLARCQASGYRDERGNYHPPNCSAYELDLRQAQAGLGEAEAELRNVQQCMRLVQQAATDYQRQAQRLGQMLTTDLVKAKAFLDRKFADLARYQSNVPIPASRTEVTPPSQANIPTSEILPGVSWAEKQAILKRIDEGLPITEEDLRKLEQPVSDLQTGTLEEDTNWIEQLLESERYREAMRDSQEAENLKEAILATVRALNYWRSKS
jgi:hypothetical protein